MSEIIISSDSHVIEPHDLWVQRLPAKFKDRAPKYAKRTNFQKHDGGQDPTRRVTEMAKDGVSSEVLYASLALNQYGLTDPELQEECFRVYNDWLVEYCSHAPDRLFGLGLIATYNIDKAVAEVKRCKKEGMRGVMIWQVPPTELGFTTNHYEKFWSVCEELEMPVSMHILTGTPYGPERQLPTAAADRLSAAVNRKLLHVTDSLLHVMMSGALDRFPKLKIVLVETEVSWLPYSLSQWDRYLAKGNRHSSEFKLTPSEYFQRNCCATFFNDPPAGVLFKSGWGIDQCMWSNDFPHGNSTWPNSIEVIERDVGGVPKAARAKLLWENCAELYKLPVLEPVAV